MTDIMSQSELKWCLPSEPGTCSMDQSQPKRPLSPDDTGRAYKTQKSISDVLGPEMAQIHLLAGGEAATSPGEEGRMSPGLIRAGLEAIDDGEGVDEIDAMGDSHRVKDLIETFEHAGQEETSPGESFHEYIQVEETISSSSVTLEESLPDSIISKMYKVKKAAKVVTHTVVEGVKKGVHWLEHKVETIEKFLLPESSLEQRPENNVHVRHPDKLIGQWVGLGMYIEKNAKGHLIQSVIPDGLAAKSKLKERDLIVCVSGQDVTNWEFHELQQFFGSLEEVGFEIVVEREEEDETNDPVCNKIAVSIKLLLEGDQVMVDIDVRVHFHQWEWNGESDPYYIFQNPSGQNIKYLMLKNNSFCMSTANDLEPCCFKLFFYRPVDNGPRAIINISNGLPLDHGEATRIGVYSSDLTRKVVAFQDDRIFFSTKQDNTGRYTFQLASQKDYYLTADEKGHLTMKYFSDREAVDESGQFNIVSQAKVDKLTPSGLLKYDPKKLGDLF